jgi:hypothetical protein
VNKRRKPAPPVEPSPDLHLVTIRVQLEDDLFTEWNTWRERLDSQDKYTVALALALFKKIGDSKYSRLVDWGDW